MKAQGKIEQQQGQTEAEPAGQSATRGRIHGLSIQSRRGPAAAERQRAGWPPAAILAVPMIEYYAAIKLLHVASVFASGILFALRGFAVQLQAGWPMRAPWRYLSYAIDTVLLAAAVLLTIILHQYPFVQSWLTAKLLLLVVYIVLGSFALKRARGAGLRLACFLAALLTFAAIIAVARSHDPLGFLRPFFG